MCSYYDCESFTDGLPPTPQVLPLRKVTLRLRVLTVRALAQQHLLILYPPLVEVPVHDAIRTGSGDGNVGRRLGTGRLLSLLHAGHHRNQLGRTVPTVLGLFNKISKIKGQFGKLRRSLFFFSTKDKYLGA